MFGSILSCTDTVAVLSLLKEVGAPKKFNSLIEGESLLNDGTCMVLFQISSELVKGEVNLNKIFFFIKIQKSMQFMDIIKLFFSLTIGGLLLGVFVGLIA